MPSATVVATASGDTQVIAAPANGSILVYGYQIIGYAAAAMAVKLKSGSTTVLANSYVGTTPTVLSCSATERFNEPYIKCAAGEALNVNLGSTGNVAVNVQYEVG